MSDRQTGTVMLRRFFAFVMLVGLVLAPRSGRAKEPDWSHWSQLPRLPQLMADMNLSQLRWGMTMRQLLRTVPQAVVTKPACPKHNESEVECFEVQAPSWRFGAWQGSLGFHFGRGRLRWITFNGRVKSRSEEEAIGRALQQYGVDEPKGWDDERYASGVSSDTYFSYASRQDGDGFSYKLDFNDRTQVVAFEEH